MEVTFTDRTKRSPSINAANSPNPAPLTLLSLQPRHPGPRSAAPPNQRPSVSGFSLTELLITLAVAGLITTVAIPSLTRLLDSSRVSSQINSLAFSLSLARSEAVKRGKKTLLCKSPDGQWCDHNAEWHEGWIVFADNNNDKTRNQDEAVLRTYPAFPKGHTLQFASSFNLRYVVYLPSGGTLNNGTFTFCDPRGEEFARALVMFRTGRVRNSKINGSGKPLTCPE